MFVPFSENRREILFFFLPTKSFRDIQILMFFVLNSAQKMRQDRLIFFRIHPLNGYSYVKLIRICSCRNTFEIVKFYFSAFSKFSMILNDFSRSSFWIFNEFLSILSPNR